MERPESSDMETMLGDVMGFTNFGAKPDAKKRKTSQNAETPSSKSNMHSQPLTHNPAHHSAQVEQHPLDKGAAAGSPTSEQPKNAFPTGVPMEIFDKLTWKELEAYRKGVRNEKGDLAWFLPSFIEDPWAKLEKAGNAAAGPS